MLQVEHARNQLANKLQQMRQGLGAVYIVKTEAAKKETAVSRLREF